MVALKEVGMMTEQTSGLFSGSAAPFGGLSNEEELAAVCPAEFRQSNPWSDYAMRLFVQGGVIAGQAWRSHAGAARTGRLGCFSGLVGSFGLGQEDRAAVAGGMVSEMLAEAPV